MKNTPSYVSGVRLVSTAQYSERLFNGMFKLRVIGNFVGSLQVCVRLTQFGKKRSA